MGVDLETKNPYDEFVNYSKVDKSKGRMLRVGQNTSYHLLYSGYREVPGTRGESAFAAEAENHILVVVQEGLGSMALVADKMRKLTGETYYRNVGQSKVAAIINDLTSIGAKPLTFSAYWSMYSYDWFDDEERATDLISGVAEACDRAEVTWAGGETQSLPDIVKTGGILRGRNDPKNRRIELAGSATGIIKPKERMTSGNKIMPGDSIFIVESNGLHSNGYSLARQIASDLYYDHPIRKLIPRSFRTPLDEWGILDYAPGYATLMDDGTMYGEALVEPSIIYSPLIQDLYVKGVDIHYMSHITGHGWRKLMRADRDDLTYVVDTVPDTQPVFRFIKEKANLSDYEMYEIFNMGAGYAIFAPESDSTKVHQAAELDGMKIHKVGFVDSGDKKVVMRPFDFEYAGETLNIR